MSYSNSYQKFFEGTLNENTEAQFKPKFRPGSLFYENNEGSPYFLEEKRDQAPLPPKPSTKNSLFYQDFSVLPNSTSVEPSSKVQKNNVFEVEQPSVDKIHSLPRQQTTPSKILQEPRVIKSSNNFLVPSLEELCSHVNVINFALVPTAKNLLGEGRFSKVYQVNYNDSIIAVKKVISRTSEANLNASTEIFVLRKIQAWSNYVATCGIIKFLGIKLDEEQTDTSFLIGLQYCPNGTLSNYINSNSNLCGRRLWIRWCRSISTAIKFLHEGCQGEHVIHLDLKPQNILLDEQLEPILSDFGSSSLVGNSFIQSEENESLGRGTQAYTPPEMLTLPFVYSFYSDIYSAGATFYFLLTGREPYKSITNPSLQLWYIKKGFCECGANPISPAVADRNEKIVLPTRSLQHNIESVAYANVDSPLIKFINGETLHSSVPKDFLAANRIIYLIKKCTSVEQNSRPNVTELGKILEEIDDALVLGNGFLLEDNNAPTRLEKAVIEKIPGIGRRVVLDPK